MRVRKPRQPGRALDGEPKVLLQKRDAIRARNPERLVAQVGERRGAALAQLARPADARRQHQRVAPSVEFRRLLGAEDAAVERLHLRGEAAVAAGQRLGVQRVRRDDDRLLARHAAQPERERRGIEAQRAVRAVEVLDDEDDVARFDPGALVAVVSAWMSSAERV